MTAIINIFAVPFGYAMRYIYQFVGDYGLSIILFSILAKALMLPVSLKQKRAMMKTQAIQPKIQQLQKQYGKDQQRLNQELQDLYARENVSPMGGCGTTLITFPVMLGLYYVISQPLTYFMRLTAEQITLLSERLGVALGTGYGAQIPLAGMIYDNFERVRDISANLLQIDYSFLGFNLASQPKWSQPSVLWLIPILSGLTALGASLVQMHIAKKNSGGAQNDTMASTNKMMMLTMPAMSIWIAFVAPAGLGLYWIVNNILGMVQEIALGRFFNSQQPNG